MGAFPLSHEAKGMCVGCVLAPPGISVRDDYSCGTFETIAKPTEPEGQIYTTRRRSSFGHLLPQPHCRSTPSTIHRAIGHRKCRSGPALHNMPHELLRRTLRRLLRS